MSNFLDNCFGSWFEPGVTFERLALDPPLVQAAGIVVAVNLLDGFSRNGLGGAILQGVAGGAGWLVLNGLVYLLLTTLGQRTDYQRLLTLTGFASLPWLLVAPAHILGGSLGQVVILIVLVWFVALQTWAVAQATALAWWRVAVLIPLTFLGALVALVWTINSLLITSGLGA